MLDDLPKKKKITQRKELPNAFYFSPYLQILLS